MSAGPPRGVRSYLAVAGGIAVEPVLGSRATDTLSGLGRPGPQPTGWSYRSARATRTPAGPSVPSIPACRRRTRTRPELELGRPARAAGRLGRGGGTVRRAYRISPMSNRVGCRLAGTALTAHPGRRTSPRGLVLGAVQVPADGQPLIFLADHPTTGGYPVIGVVDDVTPLAQARPGTTVRFRELD